MVAKKQNFNETSKYSYATHWQWRIQHIVVGEGRSGSLGAGENKNNFIFLTLLGEAVAPIAPPPMDRPLLPRLSSASGIALRQIDATGNQ